MHLALDARHLQAAAAEAQSAHAAAGEQHDFRPRGGGDKGGSGGEIVARASHLEQQVPLPSEQYEGKMFDEHRAWAKELTLDLCRRLLQPIGASLLLVGATLSEPHAVHRIRRALGGELLTARKAFRAVSPWANLSALGWDEAAFRRLFQWNHSTYVIVSEGVEQYAANILHDVAELIDRLLLHGNATAGLLQISGAGGDVPPVWDWEAHGWGQQPLHSAFQWNQSVYEAVTHGIDQFAVRTVGHLGDMLDALLGDDEATTLQGLATALHGLAQGDAVPENTTGVPGLLQLSRTGRRAQAGRTVHRWDWAAHGWNESSVNRLLHWDNETYENVTHEVDEWAATAFGALSQAVQKLLDDPGVLRALHGFAGIMDGISQVADGLSHTNASTLQLSALAAKAERYRRRRGRPARGDLPPALERLREYIAEVVRPLLDVASQQNAVGEFVRLRAVHAVADPVLASLREHGWSGRSVAHLLSWDEDVDEMIEQLNSFLQNVLKNVAEVAQKVFGGNDTAGQWQSTA